MKSYLILLGGFVLGWMICALLSINKMKELDTILGPNWLFSKRMKVAKEVDDWLANCNGARTTANIIAALMAMGYRILDKEKIK